MKERGVVIKGFADAYRRSSKKQRRSSSRWRKPPATTVATRRECFVVKGVGSSTEGWCCKQTWEARRKRKVRKRIYGLEVKRALLRLWEMLAYLSGRRLAAALPDVMASLERHGESVASGEVRERLLGISASTIEADGSDQES